MKRWFIRTFITPPSAAERALMARLAAAKAERISKNPPRRTFKRRVML